MFMSVPLLILLSLLLVVIRNDKAVKRRNAYRTMFFLPVVTTASIVGTIMLFIWSPTGAINELLKLIQTGPVIKFLGNAKSALFTVVLIGVWKDVSIYMIYWLAALQSVPQDVIEAACIDGADKWEIFKKITLPMTFPIGAVFTFLSVINSLKVLEIAQTMTAGGPFLLLRLTCKRMKKLPPY